MSHTFDETASKRRISAYTDFLMAAYDTDADGLADLIGIDHGEMAAFIAADWRDKDAIVLKMLANLTGIGASWLFAESGGVDPRKETKERPKIDADDFEDILIKVKGCAAIVAAMYTQDAGELNYSDEMLELVSNHLHEAARYLDSVKETL